MDENVPALTRQDLEEAAKSTKEILDKSYENLRNSAIVRGEGDPRFFFPIDVKVKVNLKEGIEINVKVAGEKGIKGSSISTDQPLGREGPRS